ncbi:MAG: ACT domain-containing protein [Sphingomicrobium sp.]
MAGEMDLARLLAGLSPELAAGRFAFERSQHTQMGEEVFALIREVEGITAIVQRTDGDWARVTLGVHSSLEVVGLTAALSRLLAGVGISANVVAALHHDHFFVPWTRRHDALVAIQSVSAT